MAKEAGLVNRHYHPHEVFAFTVSGKWGYLEHDWTATAGDFVYETPGEGHTLVAYDHPDPMKVFFVVKGPARWLDETGEPVGYFDVHDYIAMCKEHYEKVGLGAELHRRAHAVNARTAWTTAGPLLAALLVATWGTKPGTPCWSSSARSWRARCSPPSTTPRWSPTASASRSARSCWRSRSPSSRSALIVTLMVSGGARRRDARPRHGVRRGDDHLQRHRRALAAGRRAARPASRRSTPRAPRRALATVATLATLTLVLPTFTTSAPGPEFSPAQLAFAAVASLALYGLFVVVQTVRHRDYFLPPTPATATRRSTPRRRPTATALTSLGLLRRRARRGRRAGEGRVAGDRGRGRRRSARRSPRSASSSRCSCSLPETLAAVRNARRGRMQTSFNLALGSAMASIGLTIPAIAIASIWLDGPLVLGLGATQMVLLAITVVVGALTVLPGRATIQEGGVHLVLFAAFLFLAVIP